ncbi:hypothetical protein T492DRAFT_872347 [Pavlovales sp. CCMP2436]|nr:hypothetical protein T492DRAFT_872347 [Pavlovales sp. CCMP2436]
MALPPIGSHVRLVGLVGGRTYNGCVGRLVAHFPDEEGGERAGLKVQGANLTLERSTNADAAALERMERLRRVENHCWPKGWPRDVLKECNYCRRSHPRNACCSVDAGIVALLPPASGTGTDLTWHECETFAPLVAHSAEYGLQLRVEFEGMNREYGKMMYEEYDNAFRWTCCGYSPGAKHGFDHHGTRGRCTCDFCRSGNAVPPRKATDWDLVRGIPWSTSTHHLFPAPFRASVFELLCVHHRARTQCRASLGLLAPEQLLKIIELSTEPPAGAHMRTLDVDHRDLPADHPAKPPPSNAQPQCPVS